MALYPNARQRLIAPGTNDPAITVVGAILHVDAANSKSLYGYFNGPSGGIESHFHVPKDLQVEQYRDTGREADANLKANSFIRKSDGKRCGFVSIETQGFGAGEWNAHQLAEIKALLLWLSKTHNFPLRRCPSPFESGVGYHTMWGAPSEWTPVAKSCPGPDRIKQFSSVLVPWFAAASKPPVTAPSKGTAAMAATLDSIQSAVNGLRTEQSNRYKQDAAWVAEERAWRTSINEALADVRARLGRIEADTDKAV